MSFDPDKYLAGSSFDPDQYLKKGFDPDAYLGTNGGNVKQAIKAVARGATAEGLYAAIEGGARLLAGTGQAINRNLAEIVVDRYQQGLEPELRRTPQQRAALVQAASAPGPELAAVRDYADATAQLREQIRQALPIDQEFAQSKTGQIAQGLGQAVGTLPLYAVPGLGVAGSVGQIYDEAYQDAIRTGADERTAHSAAMKYLPAASLDVLADKLIVGKILKPLKGKLTVGQVAKDLLVNAAAEGATEGAQQAYLNAIAKKLEGYDPDRPFDQEVYDSVLVGAVVGGTVTATGQAATAGANRLLSQDKPGAASLPADPATPPPPAADPFRGAEQAAPITAQPITQASGPQSDSGTPSSLRNAADAGGLVQASRTSTPPLVQPLGPQTSANTLSPSATLRTAEPPALAGQSTTSTLGAFDIASKKKIIQPTDDVKWLIAAADNALPVVKTELESIAQEIPGVQFAGASAKGDTDRLRQKIGGGRAPSTISDYVGGRLAVDTPAAMEAVVQKLGGRIVEDEDFLQSPKLGYRARHVQVQIPGGLTFELQLIPREIADVQDQAHKAYGVGRAPSVSREVARQARSLSTTIFDEAWAKYTARNGLPVGRTESLPELPAVDYPIQEVPTEGIEVNVDVPQFKANADAKTGVVEKLGGKYERLGTGPIIIWEKADGRREVATGRHRLDLNRRSGEKTIPAQIIREADGWTRDRVLALDAQSNIRSGQGTVKDFALYFHTDQALSREQAEGKGLVSRSRQIAGWSLGRESTPALWDLYANNQITEGKAVAIARGAPNHQAAQASAIRAAKGKTESELELYARNLARATDRAGSAEQMGFAGVAQDFADFEREAEAVSKVQAEKIRANNELIQAAAGAAKRPEAAKKMGLPVNNPEALQARVDQLRAENERLSNPSEETWQSLREQAGLPRQTPPAEPAPEAPPRPPDDPNQSGMGFARRKSAPLTPPPQTDMFDSGPLAGGETGGDLNFNLASESATDFEGVVDRKEKLHQDRAAADAAQGSLFARRGAAARSAVTAELAAARARWRAEAERIAPGLMRRFGLKFGNPELLVEAGKVRPEELTGWEQAFYDGHERLLYLFDQALQTNADFFTRLNLLHEMAHAHWDTLSAKRQAELEQLWREETGGRTGPLYDGRKQLRQGVAQGIEADIKEWYAERLAWANHDWARARAEGRDAKIFGPVARAAQELRILLAQLKDWIAQLRGDQVNVDFHRFLDQGERFNTSSQPSALSSQQRLAAARRAPGSAHVALSVADRMRQAAADVRGWLRQEFTSRGHLPEAVFAARVARDGRVAAIEKQMKFALEDLTAAVRAVYGGWGGVTAADQVRLNAVLGGREPVTVLDPRLHKPVAEMRRHVDVLSRRLVREGVVGGDLAGRVAGNIGFYLNRSYRKFDDANWAAKVDPQVLARAATFIRAELQAEAPLLPVDEGRVQGLLEYLLTKDLDGPAALFAPPGERKDLAILTRRKEIAPEIRALLGEYEDARVNYARSVAKMGQLLETHRFLTEARAGGLGTWLHREPRPGFAVRIAAEGSQAMAPLNGLFTSKEIADAFNGVFDERRSDTPIPGWSAFVALTAWSKMAKTVLHPITQVRNFVANFGFLVANGHYHTADGGAAVLQAMKAEFGRGDAAARAYLTRLAHYRIVGESTAAGEMREALRDAGVKMTGIEQWTDSLAARAVKLPLRAAERLYRINDEIFKIFAFENEVRNWRAALPVATLEQVERIAAERVHNTLPTYDRVPLAVQRIRRGALMGSFVSFPAEVVRTGYHTIRYAQQDLRSTNPAVKAMGARRLVGLAIVASIYPVASMASRWLNDIDDEDEKDLRRSLPEWNKNATLLYTKHNQEGRFSLVDLSYIDPWGYLRKPVQAALRGEDFADALGAAAGEAVAPFLSEGVVTKVLLDLARNTDDQGRKIYNPQAGPIDRQLQKLEHVWNAAEPGFITQARRMVRAARGEVSATGRAYQLGDELLALTTGARSQSLDVATAHYFKAGRFSGELNLATITYHRVRDRQGATPEEIAQAKAQFDQVRSGLLEQLHQNTAAAERLGVTGIQLLANMKAAGLSKAEIVTALTGTQFPYLDRPVGKYEQLRRALQDERN